MEKQTNEIANKGSNAGIIAWLAFFISFFTLVVLIFGAFMTYQEFQLLKERQTEVLRIDVLGIDRDKPVNIQDRSVGFIRGVYNIDYGIPDDEKSERFEGAEVVVEILYLKISVINIGRIELSVVDYEIDRKEKRLQLPSIIIGGPDYERVVESLWNSHTNPIPTITYGIFDQELKPLDLPFRLSAGDHKIIYLKVGFPSALFLFEEGSKSIEIKEYYSFDDIMEIKRRISRSYKIQSSVRSVRVNLITARNMMFSGIDENGYVDPLAVVYTNFWDIEEVTK